jgi:hypothetical protein
VHTPRLRRREFSIVVLDFHLQYMLFIIIIVIVIVIITITIIIAVITTPPW